jgi:hypothetical protein
MYPYILAGYVLNSSSKDLLKLREDMRLKKVYSFFVQSCSITFLGKKSPGKVCFFYTDNINSFIDLFERLSKKTSFQLLWVLNKLSFLKEQTSFFDFYLSLYHKYNKIYLTLLRSFFFNLSLFIKQICAVLRLSVCFPLAVFSKRFKRII